MRTVCRKARGYVAYVFFGKYDTFVTSYANVFYFSVRKQE